MQRNVKAWNKYLFTPILINNDLILVLLSRRGLHFKHFIWNIFLAIHMTWFKYKSSRSKKENGETIVINMVVYPEERIRVYVGGIYELNWVELSCWKLINSKEKECVLFKGRRRNPWWVEEDLAAGRPLHRGVHPQVREQPLLPTSHRQRSNPSQVSRNSSTTFLVFNFFLPREGEL